MANNLQCEECKHQPICKFFTTAGTVKSNVEHMNAEYPDIFVISATCIHYEGRGLTKPTFRHPHSPL